MLTVRNIKAAARRASSLQACFLSAQVAASAAPKRGEVVTFLTLNNLADNPGAVKKVRMLHL